MKIIIIILAMIFSTHTTNYQLPTTKLGVTFSPMYAKYLGLDWQKIYLASLDQLKIKFFRIPTYWNTIELAPSQYNFDEVDLMVKEAEKRGVKIMMVVGMRQPRWPECHPPQWAKQLSLSQRQQQTLKFVAATIQRYQNSPVITAWQVENEPFVSWFGENCDPPDDQFLQKEIQLVRSLSPQHPIVVTESGEWSTWVKAMKNSDILGISLYRKAHNPNFGYITYPFPSWMYTLKSNLVRKFFAFQNQQTIIAELQAEVWADQGVIDTPIETQLKLFNAKELQQNVQYAQKTGFGEIYLWGVEWWFYMSDQGHPEYLDYAKGIFKR